MKPVDEQAVGENRPPLKETPPQLNLTERSRLEPLLEKMLGDAEGDREKAVTIWRFVKDEVEYGFLPDLDNVRAFYTFNRRLGFGNTKGALFAAMLGLAKIPARQHFVNVPKDVLQGLLPPTSYYFAPNMITHSFVEVYLADEPCLMDSFVLDTALERQCRILLEATGKERGFGLLREGSGEWDGNGDSLLQLADPRESTRIDDLGAYDDPAEFYRSGKLAHETNPLLGFFVRNLWVPMVNRHVQSIRNGTLPDQPSTEPRP